MTLSLATKGVLCVPKTIQFFTPILDFDVELVLSKPTGFLIETDGVSAPAGFMVEDTSDIVSTPKGLFVEADAPPGAPSSLTVEDTSYVSSPKGFAVEDI